MTRKIESTYKYKYTSYKDRIDKLNKMGINHCEDKALTVENQYLKYYPYDTIIRKNYNISTFQNGYFSEEIGLERLLDLHMYRMTYNSLILKYILHVEGALKESISYVVSEKYGHFTHKTDKSLNIPNDYLNILNYSSSNTSVSGILRKIKEFIVSPPPYADNVKNFKTETNLPSFVVLKDAMFKIAIEWYYIMKLDDKKTIIENILGFGIESSTMYLYSGFFINGLRLLNDMRNSCAHNVDEFSFVADYKSLPYDVFANYFDKQILTKGVFGSKFKSSPESMAILVMYIFLDSASRNKMVIDFLRLFNKETLETYSISYEDAALSFGVNEVVQLFEAHIEDQTNREQELLNYY